MSAKAGMLGCDAPGCAGLYGAFADAPIAARSDAAVLGWETEIHGIEPKREILDYCPAHKLQTLCTDCLAEIERPPGQLQWTGAGPFDCQHYPNRRLVKLTEIQRRACTDCQRCLDTCDMTTDGTLNSTLVECVNCDICPSCDCPKNYNPDGSGVLSTDTKDSTTMNETEALAQDGECQKCLGCGQIANTEEGEPWSMWADLPLKSALAVTMGVVRPIPCPACNAASAVRND